MALALSMEQRPGGAQILIEAWEDFSNRVKGALPWQNAAGRQFVSESAKQNIVDSLPSVTKKNKRELGLLATAGLGVATGYLALDQIIRGPVYRFLNKADSPFAADFRRYEPTAEDLTRRPDLTPTIGITATAVQTDEVNQVPGRAWSRGEHPGDDWWEPWSKTFADGKVVIDGIKLNLGDLKTRIELTTVEALQDYRIIIEGEDEPQPITGVGGYSAEVPTPSDSPYKSFRIYGLEVGGETDLGIHWAIFNRQDGKVDSMFFGWQPSGDTNRDIIDAVAWKLGITGKQIGLEVDAQGQPIIVAKGKYDRIKGEWISVEVQLPGDKNNWIEAGIQALLDLDPQLRIAEAAAEPTETPTPEPTKTALPPTPEPTVIPEATEKSEPLYSECGPNPRRLGETYWNGKYYYKDGYPKGVDGRPLPTGTNDKEGKFQYFTLLGNVHGCLKSVEGLTTLAEENDAVMMTMVFYDIHGQKHEYPAIMGGARFAGEPAKVSICYTGDKTTTCRISSLDELTKVLNDTLSQEKNSRIFQQMELVLYDYGAPWPGGDVTNRINSYSETHKALAEALRTGDNFPPVPEGYFVFLWQIETPDQTPVVTPEPTEGITP